jgi:ComF family protein
MDKLLNLLFPPICLFCDRSYDELICKDCLNKCRYIFSRKCIICDKPTISGTTHHKCRSKIAPISSFSIFSYEGVVRKCIKESKYSQKQFMALKELTRAGLDSATRAGLTYDERLLVVPIPISKSKMKTRGFNQAEIISKIVCGRFGLRSGTRVMRRYAHTKPQHSKSRDIRFENTKGVFGVAPGTNVRNAKILLVDDIITSGATMREASKTLYAAGADEIHCFSLSKMEKWSETGYNDPND